MKARNEIIEEFVKRAVENYGDMIERIFLFGSAARGDCVKDSDIDILVVTCGKRYDMLRKLSGISFDLMLKYRDYISVKTLSTDDFRKLLKMSSSFINNILSEGIGLYPVERR